MQDYERAVLIGETTYGKGSVQQIRQVGDVGFRLTVSRYYSPNNRFIDKVGVDPDIESNIPDLDDEAQQAYIDLRDDPRVSRFTSENPTADEVEIARFASALSVDLPLDPRLIRRLIRIELQRANRDISPVYDLDFDTMLQRAIEYLETQ